jgi:hypothetical protein
MLADKRAFNGRYMLQCPIANSQVLLPWQRTSLEACKNRIGRLVFHYLLYHYFITVAAFICFFCQSGQEICHFTILHRPPQTSIDLLSCNAYRSAAISCELKCLPKGNKDKVNRKPKCRRYGVSYYCRVGGKWREWPSAFGSRGYWGSEAQLVHHTTLTDRVTRWLTSWDFKFLSAVNMKMSVSTTLRRVVW